MTRHVKVGDYVRCKGVCKRWLHYTSLNFYMRSHGQTCKQCLAPRLAIKQRERRERAKLGIPSYSEQLKAMRDITK